MVEPVDGVLCGLMGSKLLQTPPLGAKGKGVCASELVNQDSLTQACKQSTHTVCCILQSDRDHVGRSLETEDSLCFFSDGTLRLQNIQRLKGSNESPGCSVFRLNINSHGEVMFIH